MSGYGGPSDILCKYHLSGVCTRGSLCLFSHDTSKPLNQVCCHGMASECLLQSLQLLLQASSCQVCKYFVAGCCSYGSRCRYEHVRPDWAAQAAGVATQRTAPPPTPRPEADDLANQIPLSALRLGGRAPDRAPLPISLPELPFESAQATSLSGSSSGDDGDEGKDPQAVEVFAAAAAACETQEGQLHVQQQGLGSDDASWHDLRQHGQDEWRPAEMVVRAPAWSLPVAGDGWALDWDPQGPQPVAAMPSLCTQHYATGSCSTGDRCKLIHGNRCDLCQRFALHPTDAEAQARHHSECSRRHQRLAQLAHSADVECSICMVCLLVGQRRAQGWPPCTPGPRAGPSHCPVGARDGQGAGRAPLWPVGVRAPLLPGVRWALQRSW